MTSSKIDKKHKIEFYYSDDQNVLKQYGKEYTDSIFIDDSFLLNNLKTIEAAVTNEQLVLNQIEQLSRSLKTRKISLKIENIALEQLFEFKFQIWLREIVQKNKLDEFNRSDLNKSLQIKLSYENFSFYVNGKNAYVRMPFDLKLKLAISLWSFLKPQSASKSVILYQIECHLDDQELDNLFKLINQMPNLTFIFFSHSTKNFSFYKKKCQHIDIEFHRLKINDYQRVRKQKIDLKTFDEYNNCGHGYVKELIIEKLVGQIQPIENQMLINNISWKNVPRFCVITGKNGVGKTTLLKFINHYYQTESLFLNFETTNYNQDKLNTNFLITNTNKQLYNDIITYEKLNRIGNQNRRFDFYLERRNELKKNGKYEKFSENFLLRKVLFSEILIENLRINSLVTLLTFALYVADVDELNELLNTRCFKYSILIDTIKPVVQIGVHFNPSTLSFATVQENSTTKGLIEDIDLDLNVYFSDRKSPANVLHFGSLSAGEKIVLYIFVWEFLMSKNIDVTKNVKCLLIDEPDSHLHPIKVKELMEFMQEKLVKEMSYQVFMTTHHPVTASLAEPNNLFLMYLSEDGKRAKLKNAQQCRIHPVDHLADRLFVISKQSNQVFVESELAKLFLEAVYKQLNKISLRIKFDSDYFKLFKSAQLEFLVFQRSQHSYKDSYGELAHLRNYINEKFIKQTLEKLQQEIAADPNRKFLKDYVRKVIGCLKHIKYMYVDPFHMDLVNTHAKLIEYNIDTLDKIDDHEIREKVKQNIQMNTILLEELLKKLSLFEKESPKDDAEKDKRKLDLIRRNLIQSVQYGNNLRLNNLSYSFGYVKKSSYFDTKEFLIYELREVENYLFDPINIFLVLSKLDDDEKSQLNDIHLFKECSAIYCRERLESLQQVSNKIQKAIENMNGNELRKEAFDCEIRFIDENAQSKEFSLEYKHFIFSLGANLLHITHDLFCADRENCDYKNFNPKKTSCVFNLLKKYYESENFVESSRVEYVDENIRKYAFGLLFLIEKKDIDLLIPFELVQRFHFMEMFMKYRFDEKEAHIEKWDHIEKIEHSPLINEFIKYYESKKYENGDFKCNKLVNLFVPDMSFRTPLHFLIQKNKFKEFVEICEKFRASYPIIKSQKPAESDIEPEEDENDVELLQQNDIDIVLAKFFYLESFKEITIYEADSYANLFENINTDERRKLDDELASKFDESFRYFESILKSIKKRLKRSSLYSYGLLKNITCDGYESDF